MSIFSKIVDSLKKIDDVSEKLDYIIDMTKENRDSLEQITETIDEERIRHEEDYQNISNDINKVIRQTDMINEQMHSVNTNVEIVQKQISDATGDENKDNVSSLFMKIFLQIFMIIALSVSIYCSITFIGLVSNINNMYFDLLILIYTVSLIILCLFTLFKVVINLVFLFVRKIGVELKSEPNIDRLKEKFPKVHRFASKIVNTVIAIVLCSLLAEFVCGYVLVGFNVSDSHMPNIVLSSIGAICSLAIYDATDVVNSQGRTWTYNYIALAVAIISLLITA